MRNSDRVREIAERFYSGKRLSFEDGLDLYRHANLLEISQMAHWMRARLHPEPAVTYIVSRNINYTNVCWVRCSFCAFYRPPGSEEGYVLTKEVIFQKIREMVDAGGIEILIQGGLNPRLRIEYYEDLFGSIKKNFKVHIHGLSAAEILYIAHLSRMTVKDTIARLRASGLDTIPGAGGEILVDEVRKQIAPLKDTAEEYETGGFTAFIPWNYQPGGTELGGKKTTGFEYLKMLALSRILLDNVSNIQASWVTQGPQIAQLALRYGANDFGSTMFEEHVVKAAGATFCMNEEELKRQVWNAGYEPRRRNTYYQYVN